MNIHIRKSPTRVFSVKNILLPCLFLMAFLAVPVQSQPPARQTNPTTMAPCGLPASHAEFTSASTITTFNMTADCHFSSQNVINDGAFLRFTSGDFIINGNGHSIIGPSNGYAIIVGLPNADTTAVLNLNNVTIRGAGRANVFTASVLALRGARLNGRNIIFRNNVGATVVAAYQRGKVYLEDVQFLNNRKTHNIADVGSAGASLNDLSGAAVADTVLRITDALFEGNTAVIPSAVLSASAGTLELRGCITFRDNEGDNVFSYGSPSGVISDTSDPASCPKPKRKKKKEEARPTPTPTPRPAYGASYVALQTATGMTFEATYGLDSGVHFRQLDGAGIGIQSIIDAGYLAALDVYGYVEQGVQVCFPQIGRIIFLDARTMPRAITPLEATVRDGMTCASISSPGSLVLMPN